MGDYWLRHILPDLTELSTFALDNGDNTLVESIIGISLSNLIHFAKERLGLAIYGTVFNSQDIVVVMRLH